MCKIKDFLLPLSTLSMLILLSACGARGDLYQTPQPAIEQVTQDNSQKENENKSSEKTKKKTP